MKSNRSFQKNQIRQNLKVSLSIEILCKNSTVYLIITRLWLKVTCISSEDGAILILRKGQYSSFMDSEKVLEFSYPPFESMDIPFWKLKLVFKWRKHKSQIKLKSNNPGYQMQS